MRASVRSPRARVRRRDCKAGRRAGNRRARVAPGEAGPRGSPEATGPREFGPAGRCGVAAARGRGPYSPRRGAGTDRRPPARLLLPAAVPRVRPPARAGRPVLPGVRAADAGPGDDARLPPAAAGRCRCRGAVPAVPGPRAQAVRPHAVAGRLPRAGSGRSSTGSSTAAGGSWPRRMADRLVDAHDLPSWLDGADALVPVPLHPRRQAARGFNQADVIARQVGQRCGLPVWTPAVRVRDTPTQTEQRALDRRADNLRGAFAVTDAAAVRGRRLVVVDDVSTTGATLVVPRPRPAGPPPGRAVGPGPVRGRPAGAGLRLRLTSRPRRSPIRCRVVGQRGGRVTPGAGRDHVGRLGPGDRIARPTSAAAFAGRPMYGPTPPRTSSAARGSGDRLKVSDRLGLVPNACRAPPTPSAALFDTPPVAGNGPLPARPFTVPGQVLNCPPCR